MGCSTFFFVFVNSFFYVTVLSVCALKFLWTKNYNAALACVIVHGLLCQHFSYMLAVLHAWMDSGLKALLALFIKQDPLMNFDLVSM